MKVSVPPWISILRPEHWVKNSLIVLPLLSAHYPVSPSLVLTLLRGILAFSLVSSALYVFNDARDLAYDRSHPLKKHRPLASGSLTPQVAAAAAATSLAAAILVASGLPGAFRWVLVLYAVLNAGYSCFLKRIAAVDVVVLSALYSARVVAGASLVGISLSAWFLGFTASLFLSLALLKRVGELKNAGTNGTHVAPGRAYDVDDLPILTTLGPVAAIVSALIFTLYINSPDVRVLYSRPELLWLGLPLFLIWTLRLWLQGIRGVVGEDPVLYVAKHPTSYLAIGLFLVVVFAAA